MKVESTLFVMLLLALLLLELAVFGYIRTNNPWYIFSAGISTAALCAVGYLLYVVAGKATGNKQDYYFYFTDNRRFREDPFGFLPAAKRK
ncbi:MAG: hypothetical protein ABFD18_09150 [Syntrophomonas sp.]